VQALGQKVVIAERAELPIESAHVTITMRSGATIACAIEIAKGDVRNPMTDKDIEAKVYELCAFGGSGCDPAPLIDAVWSLEVAADAGALMAFVQRDAPVETRDWAGA
jgi:2-methylcitrate dehydratase PrpD